MSALIPTRIVLVAILSCAAACAPSSTHTPTHNTGARQAPTRSVAECPVPDLDSDQDGIPDCDDACPLEVEDIDVFQDEDGCPDPDNDQDGIPDVEDECPWRPEDLNGLEDDDGCPERYAQPR